MVGSSIIFSGNSYFGTPSIDPLHIEKLDIKHDPNSNKAVATDLLFTNCDIIGLSNFELKSVR